MNVILVLTKWRQKDNTLKASLGYTVIFHIK